MKTESGSYEFKLRKDANPLDQGRITEGELMPDPTHRDKMNKAWEELGFMKGRLATYDFLKANPNASFLDLLDNVRE